MQVSEHFQRNAPNCSLRHTRKDNLAQFGEERVAGAQQAVEHKQRHRENHRQCFGADAVNQRFEDDRHRDVRELGGDQAGERQ